MLNAGLTFHRGRAALGASKVHRVHVAPRVHIADGGPYFARNDIHWLSETNQRKSQDHAEGGHARGLNHREGAPRARRGDQTRYRGGPEVYRERVETGSPDE